MDHLRANLTEADLLEERRTQSVKQAVREALSESKPPRLSPEEQVRRDIAQSDYDEHRRAALELRAKGISAPMPRREW